LAFARSAESGSHRENAERAYAELAIWTLLLGDRAGAADLVRKAAAIPTVTRSAALLVADFLVQPPGSAEEWAGRSRILFRAPGLEAIGNVSLACALLMDKQYAQAAEILRKLYDEGARTPVDEGLPAMLGWALLESGHEKQATAMLRTNPIPPTTGFTIFTPFYFPRLYALRVRAAEKSGRTREAKENEDLYRNLSGPQPLVWDR